MADGNVTTVNKNNANSKVLIFKPGEEYKIKIEGVEEFRSSLFWPVYLRAARNLKKIIEENKESEESTFFNDSYNNIIAFTGERGTGKSSCMRSFAQAIMDLKPDGSNIVFDKEIDGVVGECLFEEIGVIDPSLFEENDNILEIIIAQMFSRFNQQIERNDSSENYHERRELLKAFQTVYENLKTIQKERHERLDGEIIETLSNLAAGSNLRKSIKDLVKSYLKFMGKNNNNTFFLLVIDDFDLNTRHAGEMAEQIRKYLVIPDVIILLAVKLDQLLSIIEQDYREKFKLILDSQVKRMSSDEPQNMASLYLEKLIPEDRRLYLPEIRKIENKNIQIEIEPEMEKIPKPLEDAILELIYKKTGLIFLKQAHEFHFLIPDNLRDLHSLYVMLNSLDDVSIENVVKGNKEAGRVLKGNIHRFEDYFFNTWMKNKLSLNDQHIIEDFLFVDIRQKNKFIINSICNRNKLDSSKMYMKAEEEETETKNEFDRVIEKRNNPLNISFGDVLFFLKQVLFSDDSFCAKKFVSAIKTIYSLTFFKLLFIEEDYENVQVLLGGSIYNLEDIELIRKRKETEGEVSKRRDYRTNIDYKKVEALFNQSEPDEDDLLEWVHYFLIFLGKEDPNYRKNKDIYYNRNTNLGSKIGTISYATFDVLAFVSFIYDPKRISQRIFSDDSDKTEFCSNIEDWRDKNRAVLPIYSIEFLERILASDLREFKGKAKGGYYSYLENLIKNIRLAINNTLQGHEHLSRSTILNAFNNCPIISSFSEGKIKLLNGLFEEESQKASNSEIIGYLDEQIENLTAYRNNTQDKIITQGDKIINIQGIKNKSTSFKNCTRENYSVELKDIIKEAENLRKQMNKYKNKDNDDDKKAVFDLFKKIISGLEAKRKELEKTQKNEGTPGSQNTQESQGAQVTQKTQESQESQVDKKGKK